MRFTAIILILVPIFAAGAPRYDRVYVFGDSYSDIGEGYLDGNGPTAVAYLAEHLGTPLRPSNDAKSADGSLDFAISGAQTGAGEGRKIGKALLGWGMVNQVDDFAGRVRSKAIRFDPDTTLFFIAGGLNDGRLPSETTVTNLKRLIKTLYSVGGRHFRLALLPASIPSFSKVAQRLNPEISRIPDQIASELPGAQVRLSRWGPYFDEVMESPERYGIKNTTDACAGRAIFKQDATPCPAPSTYFYYHAGHPSTAVHKIVGEKLYEEVQGSR